MSNWYKLARRGNMPLIGDETSPNPDIDPNDPYHHNRKDNGFGINLNQIGDNSTVGGKNTVNGNPKVDGTQTDNEDPNETHMPEQENFINSEIPNSQGQNYGKLSIEERDGNPSIPEGNENMPDRVGVFNMPHPSPEPKKRRNISDYVAKNS